MPNDSGQIGFLPVEPRHYPLLEEWLNAPHWREWWGDTAEEMGYIRDMVEGRDSTRPYIIVLDGTPVGYIQYWFIGHHQNTGWVKENPWLADLPPEAIGVDLSIGDSENISRGIGSAALAAFVAKLREEGFNTIIIDPHRDNTRAVRAYTKAGFKPVPHLTGRTGDVLIMQHENHAHEITT